MKKILSTLILSTLALLPTNSKAAHIENLQLDVSKQVSYDRPLEGRLSMDFVKDSPLERFDYFDLRASLYGEGKEVAFLDNFFIRLPLRGFAGESNRFHYSVELSDLAKSLNYSSLGEKEVYASVSNNREGSTAFTQFDPVYTSKTTTEVIPEGSTMALLGLGLPAVLLRRSRK